MAKGPMALHENLIYILQMLRPVKFEKGANVRLATWFTKMRLVRDECGFTKAPLVSVSPEMREARLDAASPRFLPFFRLSLKHILRTTKQNGGTIFVNSNYGPTSAENFGRRMRTGQTSAVYSCNCGTYVYSIDANGKKTILQDKTIPRTAVDAILGLLNNETNIISMHALDRTYTTQQINAGTDDDLYQDLGWFRSHKLKKFAKKNRALFRIYGYQDDYGFQVAKDKAYGITISPIVHDSQVRDGESGIKHHALATSDSKFVSGLGEGVLFPKLKFATEKDRQQLIISQQLQGIKRTIEILNNAPKDVKAKFENEVDFLITGQGLRIVPKGCSKLSAIDLVGAVKDVNKKQIALFGAGPEDFCMQLSLEEAAAAFESGNLANLIKTSDTIEGDSLHVTAFSQDNVFGLSKVLASTAIQKIAKETNEHRLTKKREAEFIVKFEEYKKAHPDISAEELDKYKLALLEESKKIGLKSDEVVKPEHFNATGYKDLYTGKIQKIGNPTK